MSLDYSSCDNNKNSERASDNNESASVNNQIISDHNDSAHNNMKIAPSALNTCL